MRIIHSPGEILSTIESKKGWLSLNSVSIYSKKDLSSLWIIVEERLPYQSVVIESFKDTMWKLTIQKDYIAEFCNIFSRWLHREIWQDEINIIISDLFDLTAIEREDTLKLIEDTINYSETELADEINKKAFILLSDYSYFILEGFTIFSTRKYKEKLLMIVDQILEQYLAEQEYREFLSLLQYYVEVEECHFGTLTVIVDSKGNYNYFNEKNQNITNQCLRMFDINPEDVNLNPDDGLITILILLMPREIKIIGTEFIKNKKFLNTIKTIFKTRIKFFSEIDIV